MPIVRTTDFSDRRSMMPNSPDVTDAVETPNGGSLQGVVGLLVAKEREALYVAMKLRRDGLSPTEAQFVMACLRLNRSLRTAARKLGWAKQSNKQISEPQQMPARNK